jgi:hypothetical protein
MTNLISAKIQTKSNFRNLNGYWLQVVEMSHTRITCIHNIDGKMTKIDFNLNEIVGFQYMNQ